jgi:hypothetical protein
MVIANAKRKPPPEPEPVLLLPAPPSPLLLCAVNPTQPEFCEPEPQISIIFVGDEQPTLSFFQPRYKSNPMYINSKPHVQAQIDAIIAAKNAEIVAILERR